MEAADQYDWSYEVAHEELVTQKYSQTWAGANYGGRLVIGRDGHSDFIESRSRACELIPSINSPTPVPHDGIQFTRAPPPKGIFSISTASPPAPIYTLARASRNSWSPAPLSVFSASATAPTPIQPVYTSIFSVNNSTSRPFR